MDVAIGSEQCGTGRDSTLEKANCVSREGGNLRREEKESDFVPTKLRAGKGKKGEECKKEQRVLHFKTSARSWSIREEQSDSTGGKRLPGRERKTSSGQRRNLQ